MNRSFALCLTSTCGGDFGWRPVNVDGWSLRPRELASGYEVLKIGDESLLMYRCWGDEGEIMRLESTIKPKSKRTRNARRNNKEFC